jgi:hypothetical protein
MTSVGQSRFLHRPELRRPNRMPRMRVLPRPETRPLEAKATEMRVRFRLEDGQPSIFKLSQLTLTATSPTV